jgi:hypothetical protein
VVLLFDGTVGKLFLTFDPERLAGRVRLSGSGFRE